MQLRPDFTYIENLITTTLILAGEKIEKIKKNYITNAVKLEQFALTGCGISILGNDQNSLDMALSNLI